MVIVNIALLFFESVFYRFERKQKLFASTAVSKTSQNLLLIWWKGNTKSTKIGFTKFMYYQYYNRKNWIWHLFCNYLFSGNIRMQQRNNGEKSKFLCNITFCGGNDIFNQHFTNTFRCVNSLKLQALTRNKGHSGGNVVSEQKTVRMNIN